MIELNAPLWEEEFSGLLKMLGKEFSIAEIKEVTAMPNHVLSHQIIHSFFIDAVGTIPSPSSAKYITVSEDDLANYAIPRLIELYLERK